MAGILSTVRDRLRSFVWGTDRPAETDPADRTREKAAAGPRGIVQLVFLPYYSDTLGETEQKRKAYRKMLTDPNVKAPLLGKVLSVAALEPNFAPANEDDVEAKRHARFCEWQFGERIQGGVPEIAWNVFSGGLVDGYSVNERVWAVEVGGEWHTKHVLRALKPKQVDDDVRLLVDEYRNVVGVQGSRYNGGQVFHPADFVVWRNLGLYGAPGGMSDLSAAYGRYWILDTGIKLRAIGAEKRAFPVVVGHFKDGHDKPKLEEALKTIKSSNWLTAPETAKVEALNIAGTAESYFRDLIKDLREEIVLSIAGALLQMLQGGEGVQRGASNVHKDTADLFKWWLVQALTVVFNDHESGLIRSVIEPNFAGVTRFPRASFGGVDEAELGESLRVDEGLARMGWRHSRKHLEKTYGRSWAVSNEDTVQAPAPGVDLLGGVDSAPGAQVSTPDGQPSPAVAGNDLRGSVGGSQAIADLQKAYYAGEIAREAAIANARLVFGFSQPEAEQLFPAIVPTKLTPPEGQVTTPGQGFQEHTVTGSEVPVQPFRFSEQQIDQFQWTED